jgi:hypothetical protein
MWITSWPRTRPGHRLLAPLALTLPLAVGVEVPRDSTVTELRVSAGAGTYLAVMRDCNGDVVQSEPVDYFDAGVSLERLSGPWGFGVKAGYLDDARLFLDYTNTYPPEVHSDDLGFYYLSPDLQFSNRTVGVTFGFLYTTEGLPFDDDDGSMEEDRSGAQIYPSASLRIGDPSSAYVSGQLFSMLPVYSGGDYAAAGVGVRATDWCRLWAGIGSGGLYSDGGYLLQGDVEVVSGLWLGANGRYGSEDNFGVGLSLAYRWTGNR